MVRSLSNLIMGHEHHYRIRTTWSGNKGLGTDNVRTYDRTHAVDIEGKPSLELTTDNPHVGDRTKLNPEDLLVTAVSSCHMLSYLYLCALEGIVVMAYEDKAHGIMVEESNGGGRFREVTLNPEVVVKNASMIDKANELHHRAHEICYIASSVNFPVHCRPSVNSLEDEIQ